MAHMVIFQGVDGTSGYQQCEGIDDAVKFVEELRNDRGIDRARIFRMEEVEFEFRPYWFVVQRAASGSETPAGQAAPAGTEQAEYGAPVESAPAGDVAPAEHGSSEPAAGTEEQGPAEVGAAAAPEVYAPPPAPSRGLFGR